MSKPNGKPYQPQRPWEEIRRRIRLAHSECFSPAPKPRRTRRARSQAQRLP